MGVMRFQAFPKGRIVPDDVDRAYLAAADLTPWKCRVQCHADVLSIERGVADSGCLHIPWRVEGRGKVMLTSATLIERERPYHLPVELARGTIQLLRSLMADWQAAGLDIAESLSTRLREAVADFSQAVTTQHDPLISTRHADAAIASALDASDSLAAAYAERALAAREAAGNRHLALAGRWSGPLGSAKEASLILAAFNACVVPFTWRDVEATEGSLHWAEFDEQVQWCHNNGLAMIGGPLVRLDDASLPDWLYLWKGDFENLLSFVGHYVSLVVSRYRGKVCLWQCAARINSGEAMALTEEERLRLAVHVVETTHRLDPRTPAVLVFDEPWAPYMSRRDLALSPYDFADAIVRGGLGLAGLGLEFNLGYHPGGTYPRPVLQLSRMIDLWSILNLPLYVSLTFPSGEGPDALARGKARPLSGVVEGGWTEEAQRILLEQWVPLLAAKPAVQGILWNELRDSRPHEFPHSGLLNAADQPKAALKSLVRLRRERLPNAASRPG